MAGKHIHLPAWKGRTDGFAPTCDKEKKDKL